jgi:hypothetical protein
MNNSFGKTQGVVSAEQSIQGLGPQGGESLRAVELGTCKPFDKVRPWLDGLQKRARSMGAAGCTTKDQDRAALRQGGGDEQAVGV